jgi:glycosyltransferase involved in cell wall biosynthesis
MAKRVSLDKEPTEDTLDSCKTEIAPYRIYCPADISAVKTSEGVLSRGFSSGDFNAPKKSHVHIRAYVDFYGGYANHAREVINRLFDTGDHVIKLTPIKANPDIDPIEHNRMTWFTKNSAFRIEESDFLLIAGPGHLQKKFIPSARRVIGWTMIETLGVQERIVGWCNNADEIWCPTQIDMNRFKKAGIRNLYHVPLGYDEKLYNPEVKPIHFNNIKNRYVFGVLGSWNIRKGVEDIVKAYCNAFDANDHTTLLLCCKYGSRPYGEKENDDGRWSIEYELNEIIDSLGIPREQLPHISIMDRPVHPNVLPHICARFDCLVGFSAGESTWLPGLELTAMGKPVIQLQSECSGFMDYLQGNRYMCKDVKYVKATQEMADGTSEYYINQELAVGDWTELSEKMILIRDEKGTNNQEVSIKMMQRQIRKYTWKDSIERIQERL